MQERKSFFKNINTVVTELCFYPLRVLQSGFKIKTGVQPVLFVVNVVIVRLSEPTGMNGVTLSLPKHVSSGLKFIKYCSHKKQVSVAT